MTDTITLPREVVQEALRRAFHLGQNYWYEANRDSGAAHKRADKYRQDFDAMCSDVLARTALAAEPTKQEPVAVFDEQMGHPVLLLGSPMLKDKQPLYTAPPDAEALRRDAEWLKTDAEMMRWLIDNHTAWSWNPSRYNTDVIGGFAAFSTGYLGFDLKTAIRKAMQDSALQEDKR